MPEKNTCLIIKTVTFSLRHRLGGFLFLIVTICQTGAPQNPQNLFGRFSQYSQNVNVFGYQKSWKGVCALGTS